MLGTRSKSLEACKTSLIAERHEVHCNESATTSLNRDWTPEQLAKIPSSGNQIKFPGSRTVLGALALAGAALVITLRTSVVYARPRSGRQGCSENHCKRGTHRVLLPKEFGEDQRRVLIQDCAQNLRLPESVCDPRSTVRDNSYEVPYMTSGKLECGFEVRSMMLLVTEIHDCVEASR